MSTTSQQLTSLKVTCRYNVGQAINPQTTIEMRRVSMAVDDFAELMRKLRSLWIRGVHSPVPHHKIRELEQEAHAAKRQLSVAATDDCETASASFDKASVESRPSTTAQQRTVSQIYDDLLQEHTSDLLLEYTDDEGDVIQVHSQPEWDEAVRIFHESGDRVMRLTIRQPNKNRCVKKHCDKKEKGDKKEKAKSSRRLSAEDYVRHVVHQLPAEIERMVVASQEAVKEEEPVVAEATNDTDRDILSLISLLFDCDAGAELTQARIDFAPVITRAVDPVNGDFHVDINQKALREKAIARGCEMIDEKRYAEAEALFKQALATAFAEDGVMAYNCACALSLQEKIPEALVFLRMANASPHDFSDAMRQDPDLDNVRNDNSADFRELMAPKGVAPPSSPVEEAQATASPTPAAAAKAVEDEAEQPKKTKEPSFSRRKSSSTTSSNEAPTQKKEEPKPAVVAAAPEMPKPSEGAATLMIMFPGLTPSVAENLVQHCNGNVQEAVHRLLLGSQQM